MRALFSIVPVDSDVTAPDFDANEELMEGDTKALSEIDDRLRTVGSNPRHEDRSPLTFVDRLCRLHCGRRKVPPNQLAKAIDVGGFESAIFSIW
jgi:hypothetical protein